MNGFQEGLLLRSADVEGFVKQTPLATYCNCSRMAVSRNDRCSCAKKCATCNWFLPIDILDGEKKQMSERKNACKFYCKKIR